MGAMPRPPCLSVLAPEHQCRASPVNWEQVWLLTFFKPGEDPWISQLSSQLSAVKSIWHPTVESTLSGSRCQGPGEERQTRGQPRPRLARAQGSALLQAASNRMCHPQGLRKAFQRRRRHRGLGVLAFEQESDKCWGLGEEAVLKTFMGLRSV